MKKHFLLTLLLICIFISVHAQKIIENPEYGLSSLPGSITKIELLEDSTVLHFKIKHTPGNWISIPKGSCIINIENNDKLFVTKAEGIPLEERYTMPKSGEVTYALYFPKLDTSVKKIDFTEDNEGGSWFVYDILIHIEKETSKLPEHLVANWFKTDGSNTWNYGLYRSNAIANKAIWNYTSIKKKGKKYTITLENNGKKKVVYAKIGENGVTKIGLSPNNLTEYSSKKIYNPNYTSINDVPYTSVNFKLDSTTYSGVIQGFTPRAKKRTGMVHVDNIFTGNQDSYLINIADDGSFSVTFPVTHSQSVYVRLPYNNTNVFVEPGKETWQFLNSGKKEALFMGDCATINTDLAAVQSIHKFNYNEVIKNIPTQSPEDYKAYCLDVKKQELEQLDAINQKHHLSQRAFILKKMDIEYATLERILSYNMHRESVKRNNPDKEIKDFKIDASYYDVIKREHLTNEVATLAGNYDSFINRLMFQQFFRIKSAQPPSTFELSKLLRESEIEISDEEMAMINASKEALSSEILEKQQKFQKIYGHKLNTFFSKHIAHYRKMIEEKGAAATNVITTLAKYIQDKGVEISPDEQELVEASETLWTKEEQEKQKQFSEKYGAVLLNFNKKHQNFISVLAMKKFGEYRTNKMKEVFGISESFTFDVMAVQDMYGKLEREFKPYPDAELKRAQKTIKHPFIANYIAFENEKTKTKIEANKKKTDYIVNETPKTDADKIFDKIMEKYRDKVVFVDFWATWCGPCRSGMKRMKPLKEELKDKDIAFVYITNPTSPENTWNNMIPDIKGEHYRVSNDEWNVLSSKFNITGIPHYVLVNKEGVVVKDKMYFASSNEAFKNIIKEYLE